MNTDLRSLDRIFLSFPPRLDGHISYFPLSTAKLFLVLMLLLEAGDTGACVGEWRHSHKLEHSLWLC